MTVHLKNEIRKIFCKHGNFFAVFSTEFIIMKSVFQ